MSLISNLPFFMCGAVAYFVSERCRGTAREAQLAHGALCLAVGAGGALYILFPWGGAGEMPLSTYAWGGIFGAIVLSQAIRPTFLISNPVTTFLGKISFSLYLVHPITLQISPLGRWIYSLPIGIEAKLALNSAGAIATVVPLAWLTYTVIEAPFMKIGRTAPSTREILKVERGAACYQPAAQAAASKAATGRLAFRHPHRDRRSGCNVLPLQPS